MKQLKEISVLNPEKRPIRKKEYKHDINKETARHDDMQNTKNTMKHQGNE